MTTITKVKRVTSITHDNKNSDNNNNNNSKTTIAGTSTRTKSLVETAVTKTNTGKTERTIGRTSTGARSLIATAVAKAKTGTTTRKTITKTIRTTSLIATVTNAKREKLQEQQKQQQDEQQQAQESAFVHRFSCESQSPSTFRGAATETSRGNLPHTCSALCHVSSGRDCSQSRQVEGYRPKSGAPRPHKADV